MSTKPETTFYRGVMRHLPPAVYHMKNNNPFVAGIPDLWLSGRGGDLWLEAKWLPKVPVRKVVVPVELLSPLQARWIEARHGQGRSVALMIGCPAGGLIVDGGHIRKEIPAEIFKSRLISRKELASDIARRLGEAA